MAARRVYVVDGARTPFLKAKKGLGPFTGSDLAVGCGRPLLARQPFDADRLRRGDRRRRHAFGRRGQHRPRRVAAPGLRREGAGLDGDAQLRLRACRRSTRRTSTSIAGRSSLVLAGGTDAMSHAPLLFGPAMVNWLADWYAAKSFGQRAATAAQLPPGLPRAGDRDPARAHRPGGQALDGLDRRDRRQALRHHARR